MKKILILFLFLGFSFSQDSKLTGSWTSPKSDLLEFQIEINLLEDKTFVYTIFWDSIEDDISKGSWKLFLDEEGISGRLLLDFYDPSLGIDNYNFIFIGKEQLKFEDTIEFLRGIKEKSIENLDNREVLLLQDEEDGQFSPYFKN